MKKASEKQPKYSLNSSGEFVTENYNFSKPLANFFPGIAGKYGIPMWVFYVNRAQGIASFGTEGKDHAIMEFQPANKSWQSVSTQGFRTFIKLFNGKKTSFYEPFHNGFTNLGYNLKNRMKSGSCELAIEEENLSLGLGIKVEYFTIPNDSYAALARMVTIKNLGNKPKKLQLLDGLPQIIPFGTANLFLKKLHRTIEAWMHVENLEKGVPFYKLDVDPTDRPEVTYIKEGNFYLGFHHVDGNAEIIKPIVDPESIFGPVTDFSCPYKFISTDKFKYPKEEITRSKTPCGFLLLNLDLAPKEEKNFYAVVGYMRSLEALNFSVHSIAEPGYLEWKRKDNQKIIREIQSDITTISSSQEFNQYAQQTYLDNVIRGGYPTIFKSDSASSVFYLYSRKHGDLERDYNKFQIQPAYYSQGNGNYRDVNQNRRSDVWFNPEVKDETIITLFNLIQSDGFNPLVVKGLNFTLKEGVNLNEALQSTVRQADVEKLVSVLSKPFTPGEIILFIEENKIEPTISYDDFLNVLLSHCVKNQEAEHGEGFWTDHWTYNLDLLESYLGIYPETLKELLFERRDFSFYDNFETVKPRREKYLLRDGHPRQSMSVKLDEEKKELIKSRPRQSQLARAQYGRGEVYRTTLMNKLLCVVANKLASLDPSGVGIEMEANKPNWYDALNSLPGLFGSSLNETLELRRLIFFLKGSFEKTGIDKIWLTEEVKEFLNAANAQVDAYFNDNSEDKDHRFWDGSYCAKEAYREKTRLGFSGQEAEISSAELIVIFNNALNKLDEGIAKAKDPKKDIYYGYFINEVAEYEKLDSPFIRPLKFNQKRLPLFLEPQVHALRLSNGPDKARAIYKAIRASALYDRKLKMYKVTASMADMPHEIGRARAFTRGWLEHESIWLHMEYKFLLELLKNGLYEEFYNNFKNTLIPFQKAEQYGRSILENSSFLVSSAFPDKKLHGNGYVARLSGSTAEFLQIWLTMNLGLKPFILNDKNELNLQLKPVLPGWLFTYSAKHKDFIYSFNFLSQVWVTYRNAKKRDTFGKKRVIAQKIIFNDKDGNLVRIDSDTIPHPYAEQIRSRKIIHLEVLLA